MTIGRCWVPDGKGGRGLPRRIDNGESGVGCISCEDWGIGREQCRFQDLPPALRINLIDQLECQFFSARRSYAYKWCSPPVAADFNAEALENRQAQVGRRNGQGAV